MREDLVVDDRGVLVDVGFVEGHGGDLVSREYLADDDSAEGVGQGRVEPVDLHLEVLVVDAADLVAELSFELLRVEAVVDRNRCEAAGVLYVVRLGQVPATLLIPSRVNRIFSSFFVPSFSVCIPN